ncbi:MAG: hypothetical protein L0Z48_09065 [candidate division Zixibacteria bacterium]|nr:hypothetical protein [candidate division Zixibacteria bacterium]MCI0596671.1 hypothetical protein [candidate division Zixibacteria bacterium]
MKRFFVVLMIALLCLALVGGCGKKQEEAPAVEQTMPDTTTQTMPDTTMMDTTGGATK